MSRRRRARSWTRIRTSFFLREAARTAAPLRSAPPRNLIPAVLELGGKDAAIVFDDCDVERTVEGIAYGAFAHAGQVCVGVKRLYVERGIYSVFLEELVQRIAALRIGTRPGLRFRPLLRSAHEFAAGGAGRGCA